MRSESWKAALVESQRIIKSSKAVKSRIGCKVFSNLDAWKGFPVKSKYLYNQLNAGAKVCHVTGSTLGWVVFLGPSVCEMCCEMFLTLTLFTLCTSLCGATGWRGRSSRGRHKYPTKIIPPRTLYEWTSRVGTGEYWIHLISSDSLDQMWKHTQACLIRVCWHIFSV